MALAQFTPLQESTELREVYSFAYGYLQGMVGSYLEDHVSRDKFLGEYLELQKQVAQATERIMSSYDELVREVQEDGTDVIVTTSPEFADRLKKKNPETITLDFRHLSERKP